MIVTSLACGIAFYGLVKYHKKGDLNGDLSGFIFMGMVESITWIILAIIIF